MRFEVVQIHLELLQIVDLPCLCEEQFFLQLGRCLLSDLLLLIYRCIFCESHLIVYLLQNYLEENEKIKGNKIIDNENIVIFDCKSLSDIFQ